MAISSFPKSCAFSFSETLCFLISCQYSFLSLPSSSTRKVTFADFSFYLAPDAPHGVGLGTGTKGYVNAYTQIAQWPDMAVNFIESRIGLMEKTEDMDSVAFAW